jgi:hypothetical protein
MRARLLHSVKPVAQEKRRGRIASGSYFHKTILPVSAAGREDWHLHLPAIEAPRPPKVDGITGVDSASPLRTVNLEESVIVPDAILDEIWRVRQELVKQHGGLDGYFQYIQKLDRTHRQRGRLPRGKKARRQQAARTSTRS